MSESGDCKLGPFKEGTIKYACYNVLKTSGPRGLSVRPHPSLTRRCLEMEIVLHEQKVISMCYSLDCLWSLACHRFASFIPQLFGVAFAQVTEIVQQIRDNNLAKLGGATPANTIVGQLSKGGTRRCCIARNSFFSTLEFASFPWFG